MNNLKSIGAAAAFTLAAASTAHAESRDFSDLGPFTSVNVAAGLDVQIAHSDISTITAMADDASRFDDLVVTVENGVLSLSRKHDLLKFILDGGLVGALFGRNSDLKVEVSAPNLISVNAESGSNVDVGAFDGTEFTASASSGADLTLNDISAKSMKLTVSSGADIKISGVCTNLTAHASSGAGLDAAALECEDGTASASSGANMNLNVTASIVADASSGSAITVSGQPATTDLHHSSGGNIGLAQ